MNEAENGAGVGREAIEAALADPAFASLRLSGAPVLVAASDPARIVFANEAAHNLFGGETATLTRRLLHGGEPGASRLVALSHSLLPNSAPRLERLRFFFGPVAETVTVLCRRVAVQGMTPLFAFAVLGMRAPAKPSEAAAEEAAPTLVAEQAPAARPVRFAWRTDGAGAVVEIAPALAATVGAKNADLVGRAFVDVARDLALDSDGALAAAFAARDTWSGLQVEWPVGDGSSRAPVTLGAAPVFDAEENFAGFRGFGLIHPERVLRLRPEPPVAPASAAVATRTPAQIAAGEARMQEGEAATDTENDAAAIAPPPIETRDVVAPVAAAAQEPAADEPPAEIVSLTDAGAPVFASDSAPSAAAPPSSLEPVEQPAAFVLDAPEADESFEEEEPGDDEALAPPAPSTAKIVPLRPLQLSAPNLTSLSPNERSAFEEIARTLGAQVTTEAPAPPPPPEPDRTQAANKRARDLIDLVARFGRSDEPAPQPEAPQQQPALTVVSSGAPAASAPAKEEEPADRNSRAVLEKLPVGIVVSRFNVPIFVNRTLLDLLDYADVDAFHAAGGMDRLFHGRSPDSGAAQIEARDGTLLPVDARVQAIDWDGQPATLVTLRRAVENADAARVKALELDLRQRDAEAREMHSVLDTATDGVAVLDADGRILSINRSGEALFGYDQNEVAGERLATLVAPESHDDLAHYFDGVKSGGVASVLNDGREIVGRARQGGSIPLFMTLGRIGAGSTPKFCAVLRDLTAWKKVERELGDARREAERASALKSDFLAKVSHEIRTPLNAILGFAEVIMDERFGPVGNDRYRDYMRDIHKSGEHVLSLVNDLLDLSKIEAGKVDLDFTSVNANSVVGDCVSIMQPQASRSRVVMRLSLAPNLPNIVADERSLRQIVLNLLSNAIKFNEAGGQVIVSTALTDAGHAVVRIKDTGVGMSDSELETALEPFRQLATSRKIEGTGLGLPLTKALVEANRASFTIKSRKGDGTLVEVVFPPTRVLAE
jgi:PAS domain S-box-containing protein